MSKSQLLAAQEIDAGPWAQQAGPMTELNRLSAREARRRMSQGSAGAEALMHDCLARIEAKEGQVQAWQAIDPVRAVAAAAASDSAPKRAPLAGLPVAVKDLVDTADFVTSYGSPIYQRHRPERDAACVALLRAAGAIIPGKTVTTEFAAFQPGKTRNPHDPTRTPGGSSSGSAAAVADFMVPLAIGSQTAGSVIRPAAFCGVVGFKPSFGAFPLDGVKPIAPSLDTLGVFAREVADIALIAAVLADPGSALAAVDAEAIAESDQAPRIALFRGPDWSAVEPAMRAGLEALLIRLGDAGAKIAEQPTPAGFDQLGPAHRVLMLGEMARALDFERSRHRPLLSDRLAGQLDQGAALSAPSIDAARALAGEWRTRLDQIFGGAELLLAPAAAGEAPGIETTGDPLFNRVWTMLHVPCLTLPFAWGPNRLPLGAQLIAGIGADDRLLRGARWVERVLARD